MVKAREKRTVSEQVEHTYEDRVDNVRHPRYPVLRS